MTHRRQARRNLAPRRRFLQLALILCSFAIACLHQHVDSQQFGTQSDQFQQNTDGPQQQQVTINAASQKTPFAGSQKVGLAPHDRPACQLAHVANQRRHELTSGGQQYFGDEPRPTTLAAPATSSTTGTVAAATITMEEHQHPANGSLVNRADLALSAPNVVVSLGASGASANGAGVQLDPAPHRPQQARKFDSSERLRQLRQLLTANNYDAYLVTPNDEHSSEYVSEFDRRLRFISGFTGSNGYALVLLDRAVLFTDGRYALQADLDLDCNWWLVVSENPLADIHLWLKANAAKGIKVATDARLMSLQSFDYLNEHIQKLDSEIVLISQDLIDVVWSNSVESPVRSPPQEPIFIHPLQFAGNVSWQEKVVKLADSMAKLKARHYVVSQLDDIAWLLNLRGNDIPRSPLFKAYLFVSRSASTEQQLPAPATSSVGSNLQQQTLAVNSVEQLLAASTRAQHNLQAPQVLQVQPSQTIRLTLYVDLKKVDQTVRNYLHADNGTVLTTAARGATFSSSGSNNNGLSLDSSQQAAGAVSSTRIQVELKDYDVFIMDIRDKFSPSVASGRQLQGKLLLNAQANVAIHVLAKAHEDRLILVESLINKLKSVRSDGEVQGMRLAHWRDSLAISMLLSQLEQDISNKRLTNKWTETGAASELEFYRSLMDYNRGQSFDTISAYGSNSAIVHYAPSETSGRPVPIGNQSTYLLDSGGQYLDGTTDITRTVHYGEPSDFQRETYTRVLMGSVDMMSLIFDQSARSPFRINDLLARRHLFEIGLDYAHGTGHGIGVYSLVHESPSLIEHYASSRQASGAQSNNKQSSSATSSSSAPPPIQSDPVPLRANMFSSVEPGYYKPNDFGIRLENIVVTQRVDLPSSLARRNDRQEAKSAPPTADKTFLRFEPISLVPFEPKLIKPELLSNKQKAWLNSYNLMVRLRMTQQINYYLAKIRQVQTQPVQVQGTALSSRLYQHLLAGSGSGARNNIGGAAVAANSSTSMIASARLTDPAQLGYYNFLRLEGSKLQEKLEQTHKWIMAKTELIPLDVPQSLVAPQQQAASSSSNGGRGAADQRGSSASAGRNNNRGRQEEAEAAASGSLGTFNNQRLVLAYMSSLPFNDPEAGEAIASLVEQQLQNLNGRSDTNASNSEAAAATADDQLSNKCSGFECDFWLLGSLDPSRVQRNRAIQSSSSSLWPQDVNQDSRIREGGLQSGLMDLFQLNGSNQRVSVNMWSLLALGLLVAIQMSVVTYVCMSGFSVGDLCSSTSAQSSSGSSSPANAGQPSTTSVSGLATQQPFH